MAPLKKHTRMELIKNVQAHPDKKWKELIVRQLAHYKKKARYFEETNEMIREIIFSNNEQKMVTINFYIIEKLCAYLDIAKEIIISSEKNFDYSEVGNAGEWALRIAEQMGADEYINPASGAKLFDGAKFASSNITLSFLKSQDMTYSQRGNFESSLSIIDVLMFNGIEGTKNLLKKYSIEFGEG